MDTIQLPHEPMEPETFIPSLIILAGKPKQGKSTICANIKNNLIIDFENGYRNLKCMRLQARSIDDLRNIVAAIKAEIKKTNTQPYDYITIDNTTRLEEICLPLARKLYHNTLGCKYGWKMNEDGSYKLDENNHRIDDPKFDVRTLDRGLGFQFLRDAINQILDGFQDLAPTLILVAHLKDKVVNKNDGEYSVVDIDLAGKTGVMLAGKADAVGLVYRTGNKSVISFQNENGEIWQARDPRLRNKIFDIVSSDEKGEITVDTTKVFA